MAQLTCELCGSTSFVKKDGMFVCESCGTKYTVEEAKALMAQPQLTCDLCGSVDFVKEGGFFVCQKCGAKYSVDDARAMVAGAPAAASGQLTLNSAADFNPEAINTGALGAAAVNNYACQAFQLLMSDFKKLQHPSEKALDDLVAKTRECLMLLDGAGRLDPNDHVLDLLIFKNADEIVDCVDSLKYYERDKDGKFQSHFKLGLSSALKIPGQRDSWDDMAKPHLEAIRQAWLETHPAEAQAREDLYQQTLPLEAELAALRDEKSNHGFFDFSGKREVKDRMKPYQEQLNNLNTQIRKYDRMAEDYADDLLAELSRACIRLNF